MRIECTRGTTPVVLERGMKLNQVDDCERLCKNQSSDGCCLWNINACLWYPGQKVLKMGEDKERWSIAIECSAG